MPETNDNSAYIAAGAEVITAGLNYASAANANKKGRKWAEEQYKKQRADALADWQMQNDYNSPAAQMKRYQEAGLNKNLIYGSNQNGPVVRSTDTPSWKPEAPQVDLRGAANSFLQHTDLEMRQAQTDNIKAQNKNILLDSILKAGQVNQLGVQTETSAFQLQQLKNLSLTQLEQASLNVEKTKADIKYTLDQNERAALSNEQTLELGVQSILNSRVQNAKTQDERREIQARIDNIKKDQELKQLDINLKKLGIQPGDALWQRVGAQLLEGVKPKQILEKLKDAGKLNPAGGFELFTPNYKK